MYVYGPSSIHPVQPMQGPHRAQPSTSPSTSPLGGQASQGADRVEISREAELVGKVHDLPEIRSERVADIRRQIESGDYETDEKLEIALDRLLEEMLI